MLSSLYRLAALPAVASVVRILLFSTLLCATAVPFAKAFAPGGKPGVLVLKNGRVVAGRIDQNAGGFIVRSDNGNVQVPFDRVRVRAATLHDAYKRMLSSFPNPSPQTHVALANWCMTQQLYDETKTELRSALRLNPNYAEARNMLRQLEEILSPTNVASDNKSVDPTRTADGFERPAASSLAGMSREAALEFVTRVQPLMMNSCALAGCHAAGGPTQFQLVRVRSGPRSSRALTERNLAATLRFIDRSDADGSPLITLPRGNHGRGGRPVFSGARGADQSRLLRSWIRRVAADNPEKSAASRQDDRSATAGTVDNGRPRHNFTMQPGRRIAANNELRRGVEATTRGQQPKPIDQNGSVSAGKATGNRPADITGGDPLLQEILRQQRRDAFDPAEFNRQSQSERR